VLRPSFAWLIQRIVHVNAHEHRPVQDVSPQVIGVRPGGGGRVASMPVMVLIEGQKPGVSALKFSGHIHLVVGYGKMHQRTTLSQQWAGFTGLAILLVLTNR